MSECMFKEVKTQQKKKQRRKQTKQKSESQKSWSEVAAAAAAVAARGNCIYFKYWMCYRMADICTHDDTQRVKKKARRFREIGWNLKSRKTTCAVVYQQNEEKQSTFDFFRFDFVQRMNDLSHMLSLLS